MTACASLACSNKIHMNFVLHASDEHTRPGNEVRSSPHNPAHHTTNEDTIDLACSMFPSHLSFTLLILCFLCFLKSLTSSSTFLSHCHSLVCTLYTKTCIHWSGSISCMCTIFLISWVWKFPLCQDENISVWVWYCEEDSLTCMDCYLWCRFKKKVHGSYL